MDLHVSNEPLLEEMSDFFNHRAQSEENAFGSGIYKCQRGLAAKVGGNSCG